MSRDKGLAHRTTGELFAGKALVEKGWDAPPERC